MMNTAGVRSLFFPALAVLFLLFTGTPGIAEVPIPPLSGRVVDQANLLSGSDRAQIESMLTGLEAEKGAQLVVLTLPSTAPETIEQYSIRAAEAWRLGRKGVDDGVILLVAVKDRAARIEVAYGLEGAIPDALANRIIEDYLIPRMKEADYAGGIRDTVSALIQTIRKEPLPPPKRSRHGNEVGPIFFNFFLFLFILAPAIGSVLKSILGPFNGSAASGLVWGGIGWLFLPLWAAAIIGLASFFLVLFSGWNSGFSRSGSRTYRGGYSGGGFGGGFGGGSGGFSGGGGSFGGGGASGRW